MIPNERLKEQKRKEQLSQQPLSQASLSQDALKSATKKSATKISATKPNSLLANELANEGLFNEDPLDDNLIEDEMYLQQLMEDDQVHQFMTRRQKDSQDVITGFYRCQFEPDQQRSVIHLPFIPALNYIPSIEIDLIEREDCRYRIGELQKFGVRIEVTLPRPSDHSQSIVLGFQVYNSATS